MALADCLVTVGVDNHKELHVAVAVDRLGRRLGAITVATTPRGFGRLERWARALGSIQRFGIEGTGGYVAGLARWLQARGHQVVEIDRPNRQTRRRHCKSLQQHGGAVVDRWALQQVVVVQDSTTSSGAASNSLTTTVTTASSGGRWAPCNSLAICWPIPDRTWSSAAAT
jgi:hypothetical protein